MKGYATAIMYVSLVIAGFVGLFAWVGYLIEAVNYGNVLGVVILLVFSQLLIPFYSIIPFLFWFVVLFFIGLPIYGIYKLFNA